MKNQLKTTFNGDTLCVFAKIDTDILIHLGNIDVRANRLYTTQDGYGLIATNSFRVTHELLQFDEMTEQDKMTDSEWYKSSTPFRKFDACVDFSDNEIPDVIAMCNRALVW